MANDPRKYYVKYCGPDYASKVADGQRRSEWMRAVKKISDIEVLNEISGDTARIRKGLEVLARVSDSIRIGQSILPKSAENESNGPNYVLDTVGINPAATETAKTFNPQIVNRAVGQAKYIYDKVKSGKFEPNDIPETITDLSNLSSLLSSIFTDGSNLDREGDGHCGFSPYAMDLIAYAPKYKFLFVVQFEFTDGYTDLNSLETAFVVKQSSRPQIQFEYEDVNMYNFWTKVPKRTIYEPINMRFYDDNYNRAMLFYNSYLKAMSPLANLEFDQKMEDSGILESSAMAYGNLNSNEMYPGPISTHGYSSSYGPKNNSNGRDNILKRITLFHVYREGRLMNVYRFYNPRILTMELDELDMSVGSEGTEVSFQFAYDGMNVLTGYPVNPNADHGFGPSYNLEELTKAPGAMYPLKYHGDFTDAADDGRSDPNTPPAGFFSKAAEIGDKITDGISSGINKFTGTVNEILNGPTTPLTPEEIFKTTGEE